MTFQKDEFKQAAKDYYFLRNKDYAESPTLKLIGDRYRLSRIQRNVLFRGITDSRTAALRKSILLTEPSGIYGKKLFIDGYNVLFTILDYLQGKFLFIGNDGLMRDSGSEHPKNIDIVYFKRAVEIAAAFLSKYPAAGHYFFLDSLIPRNEEHCAVIREQFPVEGIPFSIYAVPSADKKLKEKKDGIIAGSDSEVIDGTSCQILDLPRFSLEERFNIEPFDMAVYCN